MTKFKLTIDKGSMPLESCVLLAPLKSYGLLVVLLVGLVFSLTGCKWLSGSSGNPSVPAQPDPASISAEYWLGEREQIFREGYQEKLPMEALEDAFKFYGAYDGQTLNLVQNKQLKVLQATDGRLVSLDGQDFGAFAIEEGQLMVEPEKFMAQLGYVVIQNGRTRLITSQLAKESFFKSQSFVGYQDNAGLMKDQVKDKVIARLPEDLMVPSAIAKLGAGPWNLVVSDQAEFYWVDQTTLGEALPKSDHCALGSIAKDQVREPSQKPLVLAWDLNGNQTEQIIDPSVDAVIPKWLALKGEDGTINNLYRPTYHQNIINQGAELWVLVNNSFDPDMTGVMLQTEPARREFINQLLDYAKTNRITGINLDFENMYLKDSDLFVQLVAELGAALFQEEIVFSVAVTTPGGSENWSLVYDRVRIAENCDYVTLMAYDQYWASSPVAGPVAGHAWVKKHLEALTETIPPKQMILGIPLYTRVWYEKPSTEKVNLMKVKSRSLFMSGVKKIIAENQPIKVWDEPNQLFYYAYFDQNQLVKFWFEDELAAIQKMKLSNEFGLGGVALWSLGFETPEIWPMIMNFKEGLQ